MGLIDLLQQKIEIFRLEQRYTKRRNRRSTFVSEAQYVNGEYVYSPTSSYSAKCTASSSESEVPTSPSSDMSKQSMASKASRASRRISHLGLASMDWRKGGAKEEKRLTRVGVREVQWDGGVRD